jgi:DNA-binding SARP family transcriptional activator/tetratricopeptide (TPR) repeat protein
MRFGILGPLEVWDNGQLVAVGRPQQRVLLAVLLLHANKVASVDRLVTDLWGDQSPPAARDLLQGNVARLRRALRTDRGGTVWQPLVTRPPGYLMQVRSGELDCDRFEELAAAGRLTHDALKGALEQAAAMLDEALALWRGPVLDGIESELCRREATRLEERRLAVTEERFEIALRLGHHARTIGELRGQVQTHPLRERLWALLMVALYGVDRQADALAAYRGLRQILVEQLGVEPSETLQRLQRDILSRADALDIYRQDRAEYVVEAGPAHRPAGHVVPAQLPTAIAAFTGREQHLKRLDELLSGAGDGPTSGVPLAVISGPPGIGKTTLAVHWGHEVRHHFPDGQLYVNLRGFDRSGSVMSPAEAVRGFLDALDVPPQRIPVSLDAKVGLYRSLLADRRILVVLDNALQVEQVRPLLPGAPGCVALVTSRNQLTGLIVADGAQPLILDLLSSAEAQEMLARRLGRDRMDADPAAVDEIITRCARLPLALAIVAARAIAHPDFTLAVLASELRPAAGGLDAFTGGDATIDTRAVFSSSYRALSAGAAHLFRKLGLHPGPDISAPAAASLVGMPVASVRVLLAELARAHLVTEHLAGRFRFHDLLRAYATELTRELDSDGDRRAARCRMLDFYVRTAHAGNRLMHPTRDPISLPVPSTGPAAERLADDHAALSWFAAERSVLIAAVKLAAGAGFDTYTWQLAWTMTTFLERQGYWRDKAATQQAALAAAVRLADRRAQADAHRGIALALIELGLTEGHPHLRQAMKLYGELGDDVGQAATNMNLCWMFGRQARRPEALRHARRAYDLYLAAGHQSGQANALNAIGWHQILRGEHEQAVVSCRRAIDLHHEIGNRSGEAAALDTLGYAHHHLGQGRQAVTCYERALEVYHDTDDRYEEARTLINLGDTHAAMGDEDRARDTWREALRILTELGHADAGDVRARLQQPAVPSAPT